MKHRSGFPKNAFDHFHFGNWRIFLEGCDALGAATSGIFCFGNAFGLIIGVNFSRFWNYGFFFDLISRIFGFGVSFCLAR